MNMTSEIIEMIEGGDFDHEELAQLHRKILKARGLPYAGHEDEYETVVLSIQGGKMDTGLDAIYSAVQARRALQGQERAREHQQDDTVFVRGQIVRIKENANISDEYLRGLTAEVVRDNRVTVTCNFPDEPQYRRFQAARSVRVPRRSVEAI